MNDDPLWVSQLLRRYTDLVRHGVAPSNANVHALNTLQLANAAWDKAQLSREHPEHALQLAVIGPTQSGKSTLVNVILDTDAAGVSALAGFTVHAQGYSTGCTESQLQQLESLMDPLQRTPASQLSTDQMDSYALESVSSGTQALVESAVVWDTPDFDSIDASTYSRSVLNTVAITDIVILMVSKDKYGDKSVWDMLKLIHPLEKPLVVCINKLEPLDEATVLRAFSQRYAEHFGEPSVPTIILFPFSRKTQGASTAVLPAERLGQLQTALREAFSRSNRQNDQASAERFVDQHQMQWLAPLLEERQQKQQWQMFINDASASADQLYAQDYLNDPAKYDTFNRALAELLTLLEIPGIATSLARTRQWVTWPARQLLGVGRAAISKQRFGMRSQTGTPDDQEADTLLRMLNNTLVTLQGHLLDQPQTPFWQSMNKAYRKNEPFIRDGFTQASEHARKEFEPQIEAAARKLYKQLQTQPALLNTLRAARVTADAAGIALTLKSGGLAPADLVLAPAMLSVTTLLTESALGKYLDSVKNDLKLRQREHIRQRLVEGVLEKQLLSIAENIGDGLLLAQQLEPELLEVIRHAETLSA